MDKIILVSNTRIYIDVNTLLDKILDITPNFPHAYKYTIGAKMHDLGIQLLQDIAAAYINRNREIRIQYLINFQTEFEILKTLMRKAGEREWIKGRGQHANIIELMDAIGKQCTAWKNSLIREQPEPGS